MKEKHTSDVRNLVTAHNGGPADKLRWYDLTSKIYIFYPFIKKIIKRKKGSVKKLLKPTNNKTKFLKNLLYKNVEFV